jgi:hypothetical protein
VILTAFGTLRALRAAMVARAFLRGHGHLRR